MANEVNITVKATDQTSGPLGSIGKAWDDTAKKIGGAVTQIGSQIGGELGELVSSAGEAITKLGDNATNAGEKMAAAGAGIAALGIGLSAFGSGEKAAEQQLDAAVTAAGESVSDYSKQIDQAISKGANFGHSASDVDQALQAIVIATGDTQTGLADMGVVEDLAAEKHESLASAAGQLAKIYGGNTKLLKQFGIDMTVTAGDTDQATAAVAALGDRLSGQASAASDTFMGRIDAARAHVSNFVSTIANDVSPALTFLGTGLGIVGSAYDIMAARAERSAAGQLEDAAAATEDATANTEGAGAATESATAHDALAASAGRSADTQGSSKLAAGAGAIALTALGAAAYYGGNALNSWIESGNTFAHVSDNGTATVKSFTSALQADSDTIGANTLQSVAATLQADKLSAGTKGSKVSLADLTTAVTSQKSTFDQMTASWVKGHDITQNQAVALAELNGQFTDAQGKTNELTDATSQLSTSQVQDATDAKNMATALGGLADQATGAKGAAQSLSDALDQISNKGESTQKSILQVGDNIANLATQVKQAKTDGDKFAASLDQNTASGRANQESILGIIDNINDYIGKASASGATTDQISAQVNAMNGTLEATGKSAGIGQAGLQGLITQYEDNPKTLAYQLTLDATQWLATSTSVQADIGYLNNLKITNPSVYAALNTPEAKGQGGQQGGYAHGGIVSGAATGGNRNGVIQWAEHGMEMAKLPNGSHVLSNPDTERALAGMGGSGPVTVQLEVVGTGDLVELIRNNVRVKGGGNVQRAFGYGSS